MTIAKQLAFKKFLQNLNKLLDEKGVTRPSVFISYAWETGQDNEALQKQLVEIQENLALIGVDVFLDIKSMQGDMRECMREIKQRDHILLVGTPRYKQRAEQDQLYVLDNDDTIPPTIGGNAVLLYGDSDQVKFIRNGTLQATISHNKSDINGIKWLQVANGVRRAQISVNVNRIIENNIHALGNFQITNVAFELGLILDKMFASPKSVSPLILRGNFNDSFPEEVKTALVRDFSNPDNYFHSMVELEPLGLLPAMFPELVRIDEYQDLLKDLEYELTWTEDVWRDQALESLKVEPLYIASCGDSAPDCKKAKPLTDHVSDFLDTKEAKVMLLLGASGTGKSMFAKHLIVQTWNKWQRGDRLPIFVNLPVTNNYETNLIQEALKTNRVPEGEFEGLRKRPLLLVLDGYDEINSTKNLYESNKFHDWDIKVIITCRPEGLGKHYKAQFKPKDSNLWERYVAQFNSEQIDEYLRQYVDQMHPIWPGQTTKSFRVTWETYRDNIRLLPGLTELIQTPFLLRIAVETLPRLLARYNENPSGTKQTLGSLYEVFINDWFLKRIERWIDNNNIHLLDEGLKEDGDDEQSLTEKRMSVLRDYSEQLAFNMFMANIDAVPIRATEQFPWIKEFFDNKPRPRLIRSSCPIILNGEDFYSFVHKSVLEYLVTPQIKQQILRGVEDNSSKEYKAYLNQEYLNHCPAVIRFLADAVIDSVKLQECLWQIIEISKKSPNVSIAAANAATILNAANISFAGRDLSQAQLASANLSHGIFEGTNFQGANLSNVNFQGAWLKKANLRKAKTEGLYFGERPYLALTNKPSSCVFSVDGQFLIVNEGANILLYDRVTHAPRGSLAGHAENISAICPITRNRLISAGTDRTIKIWDLVTKTCLHTLTGHAAAIKAIYYYSENSILYSAGIDGEIKAWDLTTLKTIYTTTGHKGAVNSLSLDPNDNHLISAGADGTIRVWDAKTGELNDTFENAHYDTEPFVRMDVYPVTCVVYHEYSKTIISGGVDKKIKIWNKHNKDAPIRVLKDERGHTSGITSINIHPNGDLLLSTADWDRTARLWLISSGTLLETFEGHTDFVNNAAFEPDQVTFVTVSNDKTMRFWEMGGPGITKVSNSHTWSGTYVAFNNTCEKLASSSWDKTVKMWDSSGRLLRTLYDHKDMVRSVAFSKDSKLLASACDDSVVRLWNVETGELVKRLTGHTKGAKTVAFHPSVNILASGSLDCSIIFWNLRDYSSSELRGHTDCVREIFFNNDGGKLVSASQDSSVRVWDTENKTTICIFTGHHKGWVRTAAFHPNGKDVVSAGSDDKLIIVWDAETAAVKYTLKGHDQFITAVSFSPDGRHLVSVGMNNKLLVWDPQTKKVLFKTCSATPYAVCWGVNKQQVLLATANADSAIRCWQVDQKQPPSFLTLMWSSYQATLCTEGIQVDDKKMSAENLELFRQRGMNQITENAVQAAKAPKNNCMLS